MADRLAQPLSLMPSQDKTTPKTERDSSTPTSASAPKWLMKLLIWSVGIMIAVFLSILLMVGVAMVVAYPNLPDISDLADY